ncbi:MAG TPA: bifunctional protein-serine/threonine kinase/phosphatase [Gammaproteobacteria bacterium]|nr:bifunctional protein-serine/threonine kinase/phosphatase [Gammaproteobacteria bacterium]
MTARLSITLGQHSEQGLKDENQDFHGAIVPDEPQLKNKGIAIAIADGVSSSIAGREAAESCVGSFLTDYYSTPDSWTTKTSAHKILTAINSWLYSKGLQHEADPRQHNRGMITTFSALILKSTTGHIFHVGDSRVYRLQGKDLECLTTDHRRWVGDKDYLNRAMGIDIHLEIDYRKTELEAGDVYVLTTDGVHDFIPDKEITRLLGENRQPEHAAKAIVQFALDQGSTDNITCQVLRIDSLPVQSADEAHQELTRLPFPPDLEPGMVLDGYRILREIHASNRTQVYKAEDIETGQLVVIKTPSVNFEDDATYIESFIREEWVGKRIHNSRVLTVYDKDRPRQFLYYVTEYVDGQTLRQWMDQHSKPDIKEVRLLVEQIVTGLRAFHRLEMLHQDLKPENIMIDASGRIRIIDFGSTKIAGIAEIHSPIERLNLLGTRNYTAPEYLLGQPGSNRSDIFSLGTISYELLTGKLPYGNTLEHANTAKAIANLVYQPSTQHNPMIPLWMDRALQKAVHPDPQQRYDTLSEFVHDLSHPNPEFMQEQQRPLLERDPTRFWRLLAIAMLITNLILVYFLLR